MVVSVAPRDRCRCATPATAASRRTCPASAAPTSRSTSTGTPTTGTRRRSRRCWRSSTCRDATIVVHDWGGPIGLRVAVEQPDRVARMVVLDTGLFTGHQTMTRRVERVPRLRRPDRGSAGRLPRPRRVQARPRRRGDRRLRRPVSERRLEGGRARLPADAADRALMPRARPRVSACSRRCATTRGRSCSCGPTPIRCCRSKTGERFAAALGSEIAHVIADASHFLQEDAGPQIGALIARLARPSTAR